MPVETAADRETFVSIDDFGLTATVRHAATNVPTTLAGIFDNEHYEADLGDRMVQTTAPRFICRTSDIPAEIPDNMEEAELEVTVAALTAAALPTRFAGVYRIHKHLPDGTGMSELWLSYDREIP